MRSATSQRVLRVVLPVALGVATVALLQSGLVHRALGIKPLQLPYPSSIATAFAANLAPIGRNTLATLGPALTGIALGSLFGYASALVISEFPVGGFGYLVLVTLVNSIPVVALAPLMNRWFPSYFAAKTAVIFVAAAGPMAINASRGLSGDAGVAGELMQALGASRAQRMLKLKIPASLPSVFTALKIGVPSAMLAAIMSEFFASGTTGLGYMIKYTLKVGNTKPLGWAYVLTAALVSMALYGLVSLLERKLVTEGR